MQTKKIVELLKKSNLDDEAKTRLVDLIEKEGISDSTKKQILKVIDEHVNRLKEDIENKKKEKDALGKEVRQDVLVLDLIYLRMLERMRNAYNEYKKGMDGLDVKSADVFDDALKQVEESKKKEVKKMIE